MPAVPTEPVRPPREGRARTSAAQRAEAASRVLDGGTTAGEVAGALGVHPSTVRRWVREAAAARERAATPGEGSAPSATPVDAGPRLRPPEPATLEPATPGPGTAEPATPEPATPEPATPEVEKPVAGEPAVVAQSPPAPTPEPVADHGQVVARQVAEADPDRVLPQVHRLRAGHRYLVVVGCWAAMLLASALLPGPGALRGTLQLGHVLGLVASVGAVAVIDWHGLLWMRRKRDLRETARVAAAVSPLIWAGLALLGVTGVLLKPDLGSPVVWLKMVAVLVLAMNGVAASETRQVLRDVPSGVALADVPRPLVTRLVASAALSQLAWLIAIVVGLSSQAARS